MAEGRERSNGNKCEGKRGKLVEKHYIFLHLALAIKRTVHKQLKHGAHKQLRHTLVINLIISDDHILATGCHCFSAC